jgi:hypothetical protein
MCSSLSPVIADVVMQDLETSALNRIGVHLPFYFRYVDDIVMAVPDNLIDFMFVVARASLSPSYHYFLFSLAWVSHWSRRGTGFSK